MAVPLNLQGGKKNLQGGGQRCPWGTNYPSAFSQLLLKHTKGGFAALMALSFCSELFSLSDMQMYLSMADPGEGQIVAQGFGRASEGKGLAAGPPQRTSVGNWRHLTLPPLAAGWGALSEPCFTFWGVSYRCQDEEAPPSHLLL